MGAEIPEEPVKAALQIISRFHEKFNSICKQSKGDAIARRLGEFPQLMLQAGLVPAITFYLSKIDNNEKARIYADSMKAILEGKASRIICDRATGEGGGYPQALAILLAYLGKVAGCDDNRLKTIDPGLVECIKNIESRGALIEAQALIYANEVKKLARALYRG